MQTPNGGIASSKSQVKSTVRNFYNDILAASTLLQPIHLPLQEPIPSILEAEVYRLADEEVPDQLPDSTISLIFKKGSPLDIRNFRPIALLSVIYKVFTTVIGSRMRNDLDSNQPVEQVGFRRSFSTIDHIFTIKELTQKSQENNFPLYLAFVDYQKAFDSVEFAAVWNALGRLGVHPTLINTLRSIYASAKVNVHVGASTVLINVRRGVRQGDVISPMLFSASLRMSAVLSTGKTKESSSTAPVSTTSATPTTSSSSPIAAPNSWR